MSLTIATFAAGLAASGCGKDSSAVTAAPSAAPLTPERQQQISQSAAAHQTGGRIRGRLMQKTMTKQ